MLKRILIPFVFSLFFFNGYSQWAIIDTIASISPDLLMYNDYSFYFQKDGRMYSYWTEHASNFAYENDHSYAQRSIDEGQNWAFIFSVGYSYSYCDILDFDFPSIDTGYIIHEWNQSRDLYQTKDGGNSWTILSSTMYSGDHIPSNIDFINSNLGYGLYNDLVYKYYNDSLFLVDTVPYSNYRKRYSMASDSCWYILFATENSLNKRYNLRRTLDAGHSWEIVLTDTNKIFYQIQTISDSVIYIRCNDGTIYSSKDYGDTWNLLNISPGNDFRGFNFINRDTGIIIDISNRIYLTTDGAQTWNIQAEFNDIWTWVKGVTWINDSIAYAAGFQINYNTGNLDYVIIKGENFIPPPSKINNNKIIPDIIIFPNPAKNKVFLNLKEQNNKELIIRILNLTGKLEFERKIMYQPNMSIDVSQLSTGTYILHCSGKVFNCSGKFVKVD